MKWLETPCRQPDPQGTPTSLSVIRNLQPWPLKWEVTYRNCRAERVSESFPDRASKRPFSASNDGSNAFNRSSLDFQMVGARMRFARRFAESCRDLRARRGLTRMICRPAVCRFGSHECLAGPFVVEMRRQDCRFCWRIRVVRSVGNYFGQEWSGPHPPDQLAI